MCSQELHWSEIRPGRASSRCGVDLAQVPSDAGGEPRTRSQHWASSPSPSARPACRRRLVAAGGASDSAEPDGVAERMIQQDDLQKKNTPGV